MREDGADHVYLDLSPIATRGDRAAVPGITGELRERGSGMARAHDPGDARGALHDGWVRSDVNGQTSIPGLYACGEAAVLRRSWSEPAGVELTADGLVFGARSARAMVAAPT